MRLPSVRRVHALVERFIVERLDSTIDKLPDVTDFGKQPDIGLSNQRSAVFEFFELRHAFIRELEYSSSRVTGVVTMPYEAETEELGYFLHDQLVRMPQLPRQIRGRRLPP